MYTFIVSSSFGLERITKNELIRLGYEILSTKNGSIEIEANITAVADLNINLRTADRVYIRLDKFKAETYDELFDGIYNIDWEEYLSANANFPIRTKSVKSKLFSKTDIQKISKKAVVEKLKTDYDVETFPEDAERVSINVNIFEDEVSVLIDTSGAALNKRAYRQEQSPAAIKETMAAGIVLLSDWNYKKVLIDPTTGSGTIAIEAAMIGLNIAPGINRHFDYENWIFISKDLYNNARKEAMQKIKASRKLKIFAYDIDEKILKIAKQNAENAGVLEDVTFEKQDVNKLILPEEKGTMISNPPYGERLGDKKSVLDIYKSLGDCYYDSDDFSAYILTSNEEFENAFGDRADRNRKLYNGNLKCYLYQYYSRDN